MADTTPLAPTDAEIDALNAQFRWDTTEGRRDMVRAVLARWGRPAHSGEPVAWLEYARKKPSSRRLVFTRSSRKDLRSAGWVAEPLYAAPQPVEREPLTDEQAISLCKMGPVHAPDGQVVRPPEQYRRELEDAKFAGIRTAERAHGITASDRRDDL